MLPLAAIFGVLVGLAGQDAPPSVQLIAIRMADGRVLQCTTDASPLNSGWTPIVPRLPGVSTLRDGLDVSALNHVCLREGANLVVEIALWYGRAHERRIPVARVLVHEGAATRVEALSAYGVQPVVVSLETVPRPSLTPPAVASASADVRVEAEIVQGPSPGYVFHISNRGTASTHEIGYVILRGGAVAGEGGLSRDAGVIPPGTSRTVSRPATFDFQTRSWRTIDRFELNSITWDDGHVDTKPEPTARVGMPAPPGLRAPPQPIPHTRAYVQTRMLSATTVATVLTQDETSLDLVILWRGSPGWFRVPDYQPSRGGSGPRFEGTMYFGGHLFDWDLDFPTRIAHVAGTRLDLTRDNVVLVDDIDAPSGPRSPRTLRIDPSLPGYPDIGPTIWRVPALAAYLQCDRTLDDPTLQAMQAFVCAPLTGPSPEEAVRTTATALRLFARASREVDAAQISRFYARDGEIDNAGMPPIKGRQAIENFLKQFTGITVLEYDLTPASTVGDKHGVTQTGTYHQRVRTADGKDIEASGTFRAEWVLEDFSWHLKRMATGPS